MLQILAGLYPAFIFLHNLTRWLVVAAAVYALARAVWGWLGKRKWEKGDHTAGILFTSMMDLQLLLGLLLYFVNRLLLRYTAYYMPTFTKKSKVNYPRVKSRCYEVLWA